MEHHFQITSSMSGRRLDQVLAEALPQFSRSHLQRLIDQGCVLVDGETRRRRDRLKGGEEVQVALTSEPRNECIPQPIELNILFEDEQILVVDKPAGLVVHPAAGNPDGTLQNALLHYLPELDTVPRSGIVHRLDKDTTGLLVIAKTLLAHKSLVEQLQRHSVRREYRALAQGRLVAGGTVDAAIGRHPRQRTKMAVVPGGRRAVTHYRVLERYAVATLLSVRLLTGRTHQIRVHMSHIRHPLLGDRAYAGRARLPCGASAGLIQALQAFPRQALHAAKLELEHPVTGRTLGWQAPLPADMERLLGLLRAEGENDASH